MNSVGKVKCYNCGQNS